MDKIAYNLTIGTGNNQVNIRIEGSELPRIGDSLQFKLEKSYSERYIVHQINRGLIEISKSGQRTNFHGCYRDIPKIILEKIS